MTRLLLIALVSCLSLFACKSDTASGETITDASTKTTTPSKGTSTTAKSEASNTPAELTPIETTTRNTISGAMIKSVTEKDGTLSIEYFKSSDDYKSMIKNRKMNDSFFKNYWSTASRPEKVMALVPSQILNEYDDIKEVDITLYTADKTFTMNINRDQLAQFVGQSWKEIQTDWNNKYRFVVVNDSKRRKEFFKQFVTEE